MGCVRITGPTSAAEIAAPRVTTAPRWRAGVEHAVATAERLADRPLGTLRRTLALTAALALCFTLFGWALLADQAAFYRELMPGTWLSFALLLLSSAAALAIHRTAGTPGRRDFWSLSGLVFVALAVHEIAQPTVFVSKWLKAEHQIAAPAPFNDIDSILVVALLVGCAALLARHALVLLRHRTTIALFAVGLALGAASQTLDSVVEPTKWEFVAEECLKLAAIPFVLAGYLAALKDSRGTGMRDATSQQSEASSAPNAQPATTSVG